MTPAHPAEESATKNGEGSPAAVTHIQENDVPRADVPALHKGFFGWNACRLADEYEPRELAQAIEQISADPANANLAHAAGRDIYLLTKKARQRTDALAWAIFYQKQAKSRERAR